MRAEAAASGAPEPLIERAESFPVTVNDPASTERTMAAFRTAFSEEALIDPGQVSGSEDVGLLATAAGVPLVYWILGGADPEAFLAAASAGTVERDIPSNHSPHFAPVLQQTLALGVDALVVDALVVAAREWLG